MNVGIIFAENEGNGYNLSLLIGIVAGLYGADASQAFLSKSPDKFQTKVVDRYPTFRYSSQERAADVTRNAANTMNSQGSLFVGIFGDRAAKRTPVALTHSMQDELLSQAKKLRETLQVVNEQRVASVQILQASADRCDAHRGPAAGIVWPNPPYDENDTQHPGPS